jgi:Spx/MgsR family transcriptional regulator
MAVVFGATHMDKPTPTRYQNRFLFPRRAWSMTVTIYGIKNCDTMKKARAWLDGHGVAYAFHDYKTDGLDKARLAKWCNEAGWETVLNKSGTTFRKLPDAEKANLTEAKAVALMLAQPSMVKRPVLEQGSRLLIGFRPDIYAQAFPKTAPRG